MATQRDMNKKKKTKNPPKNPKKLKNDPALWGDEEDNDDDDEEDLKELMEGTKAFWGVFAFRGIIPVVIFGLL